MNCKSPCCCNCENQLELFKHPGNSGEFKGSISESTGLYCCTLFSKLGGSDHGILMNKHGLCECHHSTTNMYTRADLVKFGNYLLSEERKKSIQHESSQTSVTDADIANSGVKQKK